MFYSDLRVSAMGVRFPLSLPTKRNKMEWIIKTIDWIKNISNFSVITVLLGVCIGAWLVNRQSHTQRKLDFYEKQLREFYSPLVGIRKEIRILSEFRLAGENASHEWWQKVCEYGKQIKDPDKAEKYYGKEGEKVITKIEYENKQLTEKIIPSYRKMIDTFKENYWLAEEETKEYFATLIKFVEAWERFLSETHHPDVLEDIKVKEEELIPFYEHIEAIHKSLRGKLKEGKI